jgi:hypothetical protein
MSSFARNDITGLLRDICLDDGSVTAELRFRRTEQGVEAAVLCRVEGSRAAAWARWLNDRVAQSRLAAATPLDALALDDWRTGVPSPLRWAYIAERRLATSDEPRLAGLVAFQPIAPDHRRWDTVLDALLEAGSPTVVSVRLRATQVARSAALLDWIHYFEAAATGGWLAADAMGRPIYVQPSPFARDAARALALVGSYASARRFRFAITVAGTGDPTRVPDALAALAPPVLAQPQHPGFRQPALETARIPPAQLTDIQHTLRDLSFAHLHTPTRAANRDGGLVPLGDTLDEHEAASLFHVPRAGTPPTPGFRVIGVPRPGQRPPAGPFVFVSYNRADAEHAGLLVEQLASWDVGVWWDGLIVPGRDFRQELADRLADGRCRAVLVVLSAHTTFSEGVRDELAAATRHRRRVIEVMVEPAVPLDPTRQVVDLVGWTCTDHDIRLAALRQAVQRLVAP